MKPYNIQLADWKKRRLKMIKLLNQGNSFADIGRMLGVSRQAIWKAIKREIG